jgi:hypothetical protein
MWLVWLTLLLVIAPAATFAHAPERPDAAPLTVDGVDAFVAEVRRATARYLDIAKAREDGFVQVTGMEPRHGYHFMRTDLGALSATLDVQRPSMLLYVERDGHWQLVGVEYALPRPPTSGPLPASAWGWHEASCHYRDWQELPAARAADCPPQHPRSASPLVSWHPAIAVAHVWAWYPNPDGVFAAENRYLDPWGGTARAGTHRHGPNAAEIAYSELNHRVAGGFLMTLAVLAGATKLSARARPTRWIAAGLWALFGVYLFVTADPEAWPLGAGRFADIFRDNLVLQHKLLSLIPMAIGVVEAGRALGRPRSLVWILPALAVVGGLGLFFHDHEGGFHLDRTFLQHAAMGAASIVTGVTLLIVGWRERASTALAWVWPVLLAAIAAVLLFYAE